MPENNENIVEIPAEAPKKHRLALKTKIFVAAGATLVVAGVVGLIKSTQDEEEPTPEPLPENYDVVDPFASQDTSTES